MASYSESEEISIICALHHIAKSDNNYNHQEKKFIENIKRDFHLSSTKFEIAKQMSFKKALGTLRKMSSFEKKDFKSLLSDLVMADNKASYKEQNLYKLLMSKL